MSSSAAQQQNVLFNSGSLMAISKSTDQHEETHWLDTLVDGSAPLIQMEDIKNFFGALHEEEEPYYRVVQITCKPVVSQLDMVRGFVVDLRNQPVREFLATSISSVGPKIGSGYHGTVYVHEEDPSTALKLFWTQRDFIEETRIYLYAKGLNDPSLLMPQLRGLYYMPHQEFEYLGLASLPQPGSFSTGLPPYPYFLGMAKIEGITLRELVNTNALSNQDLEDVKKSLTEGLKKLHDKGILHGCIGVSRIVINPSSLKACFVRFSGRLRDDEGGDWSDKCVQEERDLSDMFENIDLYCQD